MALIINLGTFIFLLIASSGVKQSKCTKFTIMNNCNETIWPGIHPSNFSTGGFALRPNQSAVFTAPPAWHGRIWARTGCHFNSKGNGTCQTGACGATLQCAAPGHPPASIAEFTLGDTDYYDVSLVDGFNLPLLVKPLGGNGSCKATGCEGDLRLNCSSELAMKAEGKIVGCRSACDAFGKDEYCCRGEFSTPAACLPTNYSRMFKEACPNASSYAYDEPSSIVTCSAADYVISFCSQRNQTVSQCTYHDNKLICNGAPRLLMIKQLWENLFMMIMTPILVAIAPPVLGW